MENILKLTVKRDVYDNLASGKQNYVYVEGNGYWIRRLATNSADSFDKLKETQDFRTFDTVSVTCVKDNAIYPFKSIRTGNNYEGDNDAEDDGFMIWLEMNEYNNVNDETCENPCDSIDEPNEYNNVDDETYEDSDDTNDEPNEYHDVDDETYEDSDEPINEPINEPNDEPINDTFDNDDEEEISVEDNLNYILDVICEYDNVVDVERPFVTLTSNGRIFGSNKRININNDEEIKINIGTEYIKYDGYDDKGFLNKIEEFIEDYFKSGHIFIWKNGCKIINTDTGKCLIMRMTKKMYLNR